MEEAERKLPRMDSEGNILRSRMVGDVEIIEVDEQATAKAKEAFYAKAGIDSSAIYKQRQETAWKTYRHLQKTDPKGAELFHEKNASLLGRYELRDAKDVPTSTEEYAHSNILEKRSK